MILNTSLLRERFTIHHPDKSGEKIVQAVGNRILLPLVSKNGQVKERLIVRAHSMHVTLRLAGLLIKEFHKRGPLLNRHIPFAWEDTWDDVIHEFERFHSPETWCVVYNNGQPVFSHGEYHPFLDVIEKCDIKNREEYDRAILIAEDVFKEAGKVVDIDHDINIALVIGVLEEKTRCGLILRAPSRTTTFTILMEEKAEKGEQPMNSYDGLFMAADYLEAIQLAVTTGFVQAQISKGNLRETSVEARKVDPSLNRIGRLFQGIQSYENMFRIRYRPEQPDFADILEEARGLKQDIVI